MVSQNILSLPPITNRETTIKYDLHENTFALDVLYSPADASPTDEETY